MATVRAVIWNVETFGNYPDFREDLAAVQFLSIFVQVSEVDILFIQELREDGRNLLPSLIQYLSVDTKTAWHFDWLPGAIVTDTAAAALTFDDLGFVQRANSEGYFVVWKEGILAAVQSAMSRGLDGKASAQHYISLMLGAVERVEDPSKVPPITPKQPLKAAWAEFPPPAPAVAGPGRGDHDSYSLQWKRVRRPAYIDVAGSPVYIVAYHAPVSGLGPYYGALACGLIDFVQKKGDYPAVIVGGDFNIIKDDQLAAGFKNFLELDPWNAKTANMTAGSRTGTTYQRSMTRFSVNNQGHALLDPTEPDDCYGNPRDVLFYRLSAATYSDSGVIDVLGQLLGNTDNLCGMVQASRPIYTRVQNAISNELLPQIVRDNAGIMQELSAVFKPGSTTGFSTKLAATIYYKCFVSDHLPLHIDFKV